MAKKRHKQPVVHAPATGVEERPPHLFIAAFAYGNGFSAQFIQCLLSTVFDCNGNGVTTSVDVRPGGPYVMKERNISVGRFWASECDYMLFIDADLAFDPTGARRMMEVAIRRNIDIMGGLYRYKMPIESYPVQLWSDDNGEYPIDEDGLSPAAGLPTGFMLISRKAIAKLIAAYPETMFEVKDSLSGRTIMQLYDLFDSLLYKNEWWGEDYVFCKRWTALGEPLYAFTDCEFMHIGQHEYMGNFATWYSSNKDDIIAKNREASARKAVTSEAA